MKTKMKKEIEKSTLMLKILMHQIIAVTQAFY